MEGGGFTGYAQGGGYMGGGYEQGGYGYGAGQGTNPLNPNQPGGGLPGQNQPSVSMATDPQNFLAKEAGNILGGNLLGGQLAGSAVKAYGERAQRWATGQSKTLTYYFSVNTKYAGKKLRLLLCPFIHRGSWTRMPEPASLQGAGGFHYKPPRHDLNAPDLYIPLMAWSTWAVVSSWLEASSGKSPGPERFGQIVWSGIFVWAAQVALLRTAMWLLSSQVPLLDLCCYGGYIFVHITAQVLVGIVAGHWGYYAALAWGTLCMGVFLVKTLKRTLYSQTRQASKQHSKRQSYMLLGIAMAQLPLAYWLGRSQ